VGEEITLSNKESALLEYLIRNRGRIVSSEELIEHVWDDDLDSFSQTVKTHIKTLRQK
jgi:DNA-binding response OmpR family regulator